MLRPSHFPARMPSIVARPMRLEISLMISPETGEGGIGAGPHFIVDSASNRRIRFSGANHPSNDPDQLRPYFFQELHAAHGIASSDSRCQHLKIGSIVFHCVLPFMNFDFRIR